MDKMHTDREYENRLQQVRSNLLRMSERVDQMIANALTAFMEKDVALARRTIQEDHRVNRFEVETDELCLLILSKWKPMASDLRFITLALKMVTDLERIGDLAVNICERVLDLEHLPSFELDESLPRMAEIVQKMVRDSIDAFVASDAELAQQVIQRDDEVDRLYAQFCRIGMATAPKDPTTMERDMHVIAVAKWLERMGDHATNLAEQVVFMVKGKDIRHLGKLE